MTIDRAEKYRHHEGLYGSTKGDPFGLFFVPIKNRSGPHLKVICAPIDEVWQHVSVSLPNRTPIWEEMCKVKDLFWNEDEAVMQLHPPKSEYINNHPYCLHLWKPTQEKIPMPPSTLVGFKGVKL